MEVHDVYLLTSEWLDEGDRHEIRLYGRSEKLGPVALVFDETQPLFFVARQEKLPALEDPFERKPVALTAYTGEPIDALYFKTQRALRQAADRFQATGVRHFEADVRPAERFLMERFINARVRVVGESFQRNGLTTFLNPKVKAGRFEPPELNIVSLDIETGVSDGLLYSIAVHLTGRGQELKKVFMLADKREDLPDYLSLYPSEKKVLAAFLEWLHEHDPDLIIGWHVIGFDLMYLERKCQDLAIELNLARNNRKILLTDKPGSGYFATISGRLVIDGPPALRNHGHTFPNYKLETVARVLLDTGKLIASDHNKVAEIERQFREDKPSLARYNLEDCVLVTDIFKKTGILSLLVQRTIFSGLMMDQLGIANASFDHYYLPKLHRKGFVAPNAGEQEKTAISPWDLAPNPGLYNHVVVLDMNNMIPSLIRIFKIEPLAHQRSDVDPVTTPSGYRFSNSEHLLPEYLERLIAAQAQAREAGNSAVERATTLQLKAICGVLHAKTSRFYEAELSTALQHTGQWLVKECQTYLEGMGYQIVRTDEDALFVALKAEETGQPQASGSGLARNLKAYWDTRFQNEFGVSSHLDIRFNGYYRAFVQPDLGGAASAKKCFAGFNETMTLTGADAALSEWTRMARTFLETWFDAYFKGAELEPVLTEFSDRLKNGGFDNQLAYQKRIRKDVSEYARNAPPHIKAARMLKKPGKQIRYVWTKQGPVPEQLKPGDIDYEHYLQKQIQPIADLILTLQGKSYKSLTEPEQISLF